MTFTIEKLNEHPVLADFVPATLRLKKLAEVRDLYNAMDFKSDFSAMSLEALRRELLKTTHNVHAMRGELQLTLGLDLVPSEEREAIQEVAEARNMVAYPFLEAYQLEVLAKRMVRALEEAGGSPALQEAKRLHAETLDTRRALHTIFWSLPDLGMTFAQWESMNEAMRRKVRPAGRPGMPLECRLIQAEQDEMELFAEIQKKSGGEFDSIESAIEGVSLSNRGRPGVSPLAKLDRNLLKLQKDLDELLDIEEEPSIERPKGVPGRNPSTVSEKIEKILNKIRDIQVQIQDAESKLFGVEVPRRKLEKLRAEHRDLVLLEAKSNGQEQYRLLLNILENERKQLEVISEIHELDKNAKETPAHQVNPKDTRERIDRLRMMGQMDAEGKRILEEFEESVKNSRVLRARYVEVNSKVS